MTRLQKKDSIQASLDFVSEEIAAIKNERAAIKELVAEVKALTLENEKKGKQIAYLEYRVAELEQYTRINNVIITGLQVKPRSYARAVNSEDVAGEMELDAGSTELQVAAFFQSQGIDLKCDNIEVCYPLPP